MFVDWFVFRELMVFKDEDKEYAESYPSLSDIFELIAIGEEMKKVISIKIYFLPISVRISTRKNYNRPSNVFFPASEDNSTRNWVVSKNWISQL